MASSDGSDIAAVCVCVSDAQTLWSKPEVLVCVRVCVCDRDKSLQRHTHTHTARGSFSFMFLSQSEIKKENYKKPADQCHPALESKIFSLHLSLMSSFLFFIPFLSISLTHTIFVDLSIHLATLNFASLFAWRTNLWSSLNTDCHYTKTCALKCS